MAQLMPLPLTVSCFSKIQIGFTLLVGYRLTHAGTVVLDKGPLHVSPSSYLNVTLTTERHLYTAAQVLEEATHEILGQVNKQLTENRLTALVPEAHSIDLVISLQSV